MSKKPSVVDRLTDTRNYTGAHKERFDESGHGRGIAGRRDNAQVDDLSQITRPEMHANDTTGTHHDTVPKAKLEKFGTQATAPSSIMVWKHGDKHDKGDKVMLKNFKTLDQLKVQLATKLGMLPALRGLYTPAGHLIGSLEELQDKHNYVAVKTGFKFDREHLPALMPADN